MLTPGQQVERHFGVEWLVTDRFYVDAGDPASIDLAPHCQPVSFGQALGGNMRVSKRLDILHVSPARNVGVKRSRRMLPPSSRTCVPLND
jgi:hypothetical protein